MGIKRGGGGGGAREIVCKRLFLGVMVLVLVPGGEQDAFEGAGGGGARLSCLVVVGNTPHSVLAVFVSLG